MIGRVEVQVAMIVVGPDHAVELAKELHLDREVLDHGLDDEVAVGEVGEFGGGAERAGVASAASSTSRVPFSTWLGERLVDRDEHGVGARHRARAHDDHARRLRRRPRRCRRP